MGLQLVETPRADELTLGDLGDGPRDFGVHRSAGWGEFRVHRALFLASLTLQSVGVRQERPGGDDHEGSLELRAAG